MLDVRWTTLDPTLNTMKKLALLTALVVTAGLLNVGCAASGSIKPTGSVTPATSMQVAYNTVSVPAK